MKFGIKNSETPTKIEHVPEQKLVKAELTENAALSKRIYRGVVILAFVVIVQLAVTMWGVWENQQQNLIVAKELELLNQQKEAKQPIPEATPKTESTPEIAIKTQPEYKSPEKRLPPVGPVTAKPADPVPNTVNEEPPEQPTEPAVQTRETSSTEDKSQVTDDASHDTSADASDSSETTDSTDSPAGEDRQ